MGWMEAKDWLLNFLAGRKPMPSKEVISAAAAAGITHRVLCRAKEDIPVRIFQSGRCWYWQLKTLR